MQHLVLSTDNIPPRLRFSYWREAVAELGIPGERDRAPEARFDGRLALTSGGYLTRFRFCSSKYRVRRRSRDVAPPDGEDRIWLYRDIGGGSWHDDDGRQFITRAGEVIIGDPDLALATEALDRYDHEIWHFPRALLDPHLPAALHPHLLRLSGRDGINGIVLSYLAMLSDNSSRSTMRKPRRSPTISAVCSRSFAAVEPAAIGRRSERRGSSKRKAISASTSRTRI